MTDGRDGLAGIGEGPDQVDRRLVRPQLVRIANAAGQDERVIILDAGILDGQVGTDGLAWIVVDRRLDRLQVGRGELHLGSAIAKDLQGPEQLRFFEAVGCDDQDLGIG